MQQKTENFKKAWAKIVAKAWSDPDFKKKLLKDPNAVFKSEGIDVPAGKRIVISESTKDTYYLTLPEKPSGELSEEKLKEVAAGGQPTLSLC
jgi:hypothetical protein